MKTQRCPNCKGKGEVYAESTYPPRSREYMYLVTCRTCGGTGKLAAKKAK